MLLTDIVPALPKTLSAQALFSNKTGQSGNRHSVPPHGEAHLSTSVSGAPGSGREENVSLRLNATAEVPAPRIKSEVSEGLSQPLYISYCKSRLTGHRARGVSGTHDSSVRCLPRQKISSHCFHTNRRKYPISSATKPYSVPCGYLAAFQRPGDSQDSCESRTPGT